MEAPHDHWPPKRNDTGRPWRRTSATISDHDMCEVHLAVASPRTSEDFEINSCSGGRDSPMALVIPGTHPQALSGFQCFYLYSVAPDAKKCLFQHVCFHRVRPLLPFLLELQINEKPLARVTCVNFKVVYRKVLLALHRGSRRLSRDMDSTWGNLAW